MRTPLVMLLVVWGSASAQGFALLVWETDGCHVDRVVVSGGSDILIDDSRSRSMRAESAEREVLIDRTERARTVSIVRQAEVETGIDLAIPPRAETCELSPSSSIRTATVFASPRMEEDIASPIPADPAGPIPADAARYVAADPSWAIVFVIALGGRWLYKRHPAISRRYSHAATRFDLDRDEPL